MESEFAKYTLEKGVLVVTFKPIVVDLKAAKDIVAKRLEFSNNKTLPGLADVRLMKSFERDARTYLQGPAGKQGLNAAALLTESAFTTYIANFFLKVSYKKDKDLPSMVFNDKDKAIDWLQEFRND
ncbi:MAG: hypothetical protein MRY83_19865 [Flavobacteriales bacterium]|nr:hypothetical protein [Flavobacteriales bacterium]